MATFRTLFYQSLHQLKESMSVVFYQHQRHTLELDLCLDALILDYNRLKSHAQSCCLNGAAIMVAGLARTKQRLNVLQDLVRNAMWKLEKDLDMTLEDVEAAQRQLSHGMECVNTLVFDYLDSFKALETEVNNTVLAAGRHCPLHFVDLTKLLKFALNVCLETMDQHTRRLKDQGHKFSLLLEEEALNFKALTLT